MRFDARGTMDPSFAKGGAWIGETSGDHFAVGTLDRNHLIVVNARGMGGAVGRFLMK